MGDLRKAAIGSDLSNRPFPMQGIAEKLTSPIDPEFHQVIDGRIADRLFEDPGEVGSVEFRGHREFVQAEGFTHVGVHVINGTLNPMLVPCF